MSKPAFQVSEALGAACITCQVMAYREEHGGWPSAAMMNHAVMWGCTCSPQAEAEAIAYMEAVTR
jgi:hypothetical protein